MAAAAAPFVTTCALERGGPNKAPGDQGTPQRSWEGDGHAPESHLSPWSVGGLGPCPPSQVCLPLVPAGIQAAPRPWEVAVHTHLSLPCRISLAPGGPQTRAVGPRLPPHYQRCTRAERWLPDTGLVSRWSQGPRVPSQGSVATSCACLDCRPLRPLGPLTVCPWLLPTLFTPLLWVDLELGQPALSRGVLTAWAPSSCTQGTVGSQVACPPAGPSASQRAWSSFSIGAGSCQPSTASSAEPVMLPTQEVLTAGQETPEQLPNFTDVHVLGLRGDRAQQQALSLP